MVSPAHRPISSRHGFAQIGDCLRIQSQLGKNGLGLGPHRWHCIHANRHIGKLHRRQQRVNEAARSIELPPALARLQLRMIPEVLRGIHLRVGNACRIQATDNFIG